MLSDYFRQIKKTKGRFGIEVETETKGIEVYPSDFFKMQGYDNHYTLTGIEDFVGHQDGSLRNFGMEFVSKKPLDFNEMVLSIRNLFEKLKDVSFIEDAPATSVHVHMNISDMKVRELGNLLTTWILFENLIVDFCGEMRRTNLFALPNRCAEMTTLTIVKMFLSLDKFDTEKNNPYPFHHLTDDMYKYGAVNLAAIKKFGSVEFRSMRGTTDPDEIVDWLMILEELYRFSVQDGLDPNRIMTMYREDDITLFHDVFPNTAELLLNSDVNISVFSSRNAWSAGQIAASVTDWTKIDEKMPSKGSKKKSETAMNNHFDTMIYGGPTLGVSTQSVPAYGLTDEVDNLYIPDTDEGDDGEF